LQIRPQGFPQVRASKLGYFPDSFRNMGQAPQILKQAGIDTAVFGRGVKPTGFNNEVSTSDRFESPFSEMIWKGPDGSSVLGILFANWYNNGMEIPVDEKEPKLYWEKRMQEAGEYATTDHLLFMNGCYHQPVQTDLTDAMKTAERLFPTTEFKHSNLHDYIREVRQSIKDELKVVNGELRSQQTNGWGTLVNTASTRVYLKQMNQQGQTLLEKVAEPLASFASILGGSYPIHLLTHAWKTLMQNHPHDSICGCSIDEVHREMVTRFEKSRNITEEIIDQSLTAIGENVDTSEFKKMGSDPKPFSVFNSTGWEKSGVVTIELDIERFYFNDVGSPQEAAARARDIYLGEFELVDHEGNGIPFTLEDLGSRFGYDLPENQFRQPFMARKVKVTFEAEKLTALGYKTYALVGSTTSSPKPSISMVKNSRRIENDNLDVRFAENGSMTIKDKRTGFTYNDLCIYEDSGDIGNEYMFKQPEGEKPITTKGIVARIEIVEDSPYRATFKVVHEWMIPAGANQLLNGEINDMVPFPERKAERVQEKVSLRIDTYVSLEKSARSIKVKTIFHNNATDHRLRVLFPTDLNTKTHEVDSIFEVANRDIEPSPVWHQQAFVSLNDSVKGLTIANKGLNEYEILRDGLKRPYSPGSFPPLTANCYV